AGIVRMLGEDELGELLDDPGWVELTCEFCNRSFRYDDADVDAILRSEAPRQLLHEAPGAGAERHGPRRSRAARSRSAQRHAAGADAILRGEAPRQLLH